MIKEGLFTAREPIKLLPLKMTFIDGDEGPSPFTKGLHWDYECSRITSRHGRSFEIKPPVSKGVLWKDKYGISYGTRGVKGYPDNEPVLSYDPYYPSEIRVNGLKESTGVEHIELASAYMRQNGLPTERIVGKYRLDEVPVNGRTIPIEEWKQRLINNPPVIVDPEGKEPPISPDQIRTYLETNDFLVLVRDSQVGERLGDFKVFNSIFFDDRFVVVNEDDSVFVGDIKVGNIEELRSNRPCIFEKFATVFEKIGEMDSVKEWREDFNKGLDYICAFLDKNKGYRGIVSDGSTFRENLGNVFQWLNVKNRYEESFNANNDEDIVRYFCDYLPRQMGDYLAKFHALGLAHGFSTAHNWTFVGTLVDLASVHGKPLGDAEITSEDKTRDVLFSCRGISSYFSCYPLSLVLPNGDRLTYEGYLKQIFKEKVEEMKKDAIWNFVSSYITSRDILKGFEATEDSEYYLSEAEKLGVFNTKIGLLV